MLVETTEKLELKSRRLKWALVSVTSGAVLTALDLLLVIAQMADTPQTQKKEPPPRPPGQPDPKLITYLERRKDDGDGSEEPGAEKRKS